MQRNTQISLARSRKLELRVSHISIFERTYWRLGTGEAIINEVSKLRKIIESQNSWNDIYFSYIYLRLLK